MGRVNFPEPCRSCKYRAGEWSPHNCDYAWMTGKSRSAQVKSPDELQRDKCPFFVKGKRIMIDPHDAIFGRKNNETS